MFYAHFVLAKKGPLARIWLAAHWDKKLTKAHVFETNIESSVEGILQPKVKMALRTSGHLLLGIVRIYSRKAKYLLADCNEAFIKIKIAFRPGVVDLPEGNREAAVAAITLPEVFHDFDTALPDITIDMDAQVSLNQSRAEDITLKEDYGNFSLMTDDGFDDMGFDETVEGMREAVMDDGFDHATMLLSCEDAAQERPADENTPVAAAAATTPSSTVDKRLNAPLKDDGFGGTVGEGLLDGETGGFFEPAGLFDDAPLGPVGLDSGAPADPTVPGENVDPPPYEKPAEPHPDEDSDDDMYDMAPGSIGAPSPPSSPESPGPPLETPVEPESSRLPPAPHHPEEEPALLPPSERGTDPPSDPSQDMLPPAEEMPPPPVPPIPPLDHTTLINNDAESFALAPLDATIMHAGAERTVKAKRKRKLVVDEVKSISGEEMKSQLSDTTDIVATLDLAPPTKRLMHWKETGGVEKLFSLPGHRILSKTLTRSYLRHLTTRSVENEVYGNDDEQDELDTDLEKNREKDDDSVVGSVKRRRLLDSDLPADVPHLDSYHLDPTRTSFPVDAAALPHPSMGEVVPPGFMPPQHSLFSCDLPSSHMMLQSPDLHQLPHIPQMMDSMVNQGPSLHSITPSINSDALPPPPGLPDHHSVIESQHLHQSALAPPPPEPPHPLSDPPLPPPVEEPQPPPMNGSDDNTLIPDQFPPVPSDTRLPELEPPQPQEVPPQQNGMELAPPSESISPQTTAANLIFDSLIADMPPQNTTSINNNEGPQHNDEVPHDKHNDFLGSDDDDDFGAPPSVGPILPEEQMADETYEQFEERILTKRTTHLLHVIHNALDENRSVSFTDLVRNNKRKQVAQKFYTFLVLKKQQAVELEQNPSYGDLIITRGPKYTAVYNGN